MIPIKTGHLPLAAPAVLVVLVGGAPLACTSPTPPTPLAPGIRFVDVPSAFVFPADDVDDERAGLQVAVHVAVDANDGADIGDVVVSGPTGDVVASASDAGLVAVVTLPTGPAPGLDLQLIASATVDGVGINARRDVVARDAAPEPPAPPAPIVCSIAVASDGDATVACSGGEPSPSAQSIASGGLIQLAVHPNGQGDTDVDEIRRLQHELRGGEATLPFPFVARGSGRYRYDVVLAGSVGFGDSPDVGVVVGTDADVVIDD